MTAIQEHVFKSLMRTKSDLIGNPAMTESEFLDLVEEALDLAERAELTEWPPRHVTSTRS